MEYQIIRQADCHTGHWSGGSTTELFLWPQGTCYVTRDFSVRASTATVEADTSVFTPLPGYTRLLMTVRGEMRLEIEGREDVQLPPWQSVRFDGGVKTCSFGRCVDFGVMLGKGWDGTLRAVRTGTITCHANGLTGVYAPAGPVEIILSAAGASPRTVTLEQGELLVARYSGQLELHPTEIAIVFTAWE